MGLGTIRWRICAEVNLKRVDDQILDRIGEFDLVSVVVSIVRGIGERWRGSHEVAIEGNRRVVEEQHKSVILQILLLNCSKMRFDRGHRGSVGEVCSILVDW